MQQNFGRATQFTFSMDGKTNDYYWVLGNKNNPPLLLIHGYTGTHNDLLEFADHLREKYFVIVPDLPGWGKSPRFPDTLSIENYAVYLKSLLDSLKIHKTTIVGHCMGTAISIELAYRYPTIAEKIILISTPYITGTMNEKVFLHLANVTQHSPKRIRRIFFIWRSRLIVIPLGFYFIKVRGFKKKLRLMKHYIKIQPFQKEDTVEENFESGIHYKYEKVKLIKSPIHLIHGYDDVIINRDDAIKFHQLIPSSTIEFIPHAGHVPPMETPQSLATLILRY